MTIHIVQSGETIYSIADRYGVSVDRLILDNGILNPSRLVVGETIVILRPEMSYTIQEGDTLASIADKHEVTVFQLLRNNPYLSDREYIYPGETIVISYEEDKIRTIATNAAYFQYISDNEYIARFLDARSIDNFVKLVPEFGLKGINIWNIMNWSPQMWMVINSQYEIEKVML